MIRFLILVAIGTLLFTLFRSFLRYLREAAQQGRAVQQQDAAEAKSIDWYRANGYVEWVRHEIDYTVYTPAGNREGEIVVEQQRDYSPWFIAGSDEERQWHQRESAKPTEEGAEWSDRWIRGRGIRGQQSKWLPPGEKAS